MESKVNIAQQLHDIQHHHQHPGYKYNLSSRPLSYNDEVPTGRRMSQPMPYSSPTPPPPHVATEQRTIQSSKWPRFSLQAKCNSYLHRESFDSLVASAWPCTALSLFSFSSWTSTFSLSFSKRMFSSCSRCKENSRNKLQVHIRWEPVNIPKSGICYFRYICSSCLNLSPRDHSTLAVEAQELAPYSALLPRGQTTKQKT